MIAIVKITYNEV